MHQIGAGTGGIGEPMLKGNREAQDLQGRKREKLLCAYVAAVSELIACGKISDTFVDQDELWTAIRSLAHTFTIPARLCARTAATPSLELAHAGGLCAATSAAASSPARLCVGIAA